MMKINELPCDDAFSNIISFLDFKSAIRFSKLTHPSIRSRIFPTQNSCQNYHGGHGKDDSDGDDDGCDYVSGQRNHQIARSSLSLSSSLSSSPPSSSSMMCYTSLWKDFYQRHLFAPFPPPASKTLATLRQPRSNDDYLDFIRYKQSLHNNLIQCKSTKTKDTKANQTKKSKFSTKKIRDKKNRQFGLPDSYFSFVPITPTTFIRTSASSPDRNQDDDSPPVDFACTSFIFTSSNTSSEMAYLDPFHGSLNVYENVMDYALLHSCATTKSYNSTANSSTTTTTTTTTSNSNSNSISDKRPKYNSETLIGVQDYFNLDMKDYFDFQHNTNSSNGNNTIPIYDPNNEDSDEVVVDWLGIDSHTIIDKHTYEQIGTMVCAARTIIVENPLINAMNQPQNQNTQRLMNPFQNQNLRLFQNDHSDSAELAVTEILAWKKDFHHPVISSSSSSTCSCPTTSFHDHPYICRMDHSPYFIEVCPTSYRVFASFSSDTPMKLKSGVLITRACDDDNDTVMDLDDNDGEGDDNDTVENNDHSSEDNRIFIFPLLEKNKHEEESNDGRKYFSDIQECIHCDNPVTSFIVDPFGENLIVGTANGSIELWNVSQMVKSRSCILGASRRQKIDMKRELRSLVVTPILASEAKTAAEDVDRVASSLNTYSSDCRNNSCDEDSTNDCFDQDNNPYSLIDETIYSVDQQHVEYSDFGSSTDQDPNFLHIPQNEESRIMDDLVIINNEDEGIDENYRGALSLPQCKPSRSFSSVEIPPHLTIHAAGFVGVQHHHNEGTTLSYWHCQREGKEFKLASLVNLPLSAQPKPQVSFDGKRIIVFGQDHIGVIILVYDVLSSCEDHHQASRTSSNGRYSEDSGGVINLSSPRRVEYSNRIRHSGLGGFEFYDFMFMSVNERYIALNTKTGNLLSQNEENGLSRCEGLFIIDLEDGNNA